MAYISVSLCVQGLLSLQYDSNAKQAIQFPALSMPSKLPLIISESQVKDALAKRALKLQQEAQILPESSNKWGLSFDDIIIDSTDQTNRTFL